MRWAIGLMLMGMSVGACSNPIAPSIGNTNGTQFAPDKWEREVRVTYPLCQYAPEWKWCRDYCREHPEICFKR